MRRWPIRFQLPIRRTLALLTASLPLVALGMGGVNLLTWIRIQQGNLYYVEGTYLSDAAWWGLIGLSGVLPAGWVLCKPRVHLRWLWLPIFISIVVLLYPGATTYELISAVPHVRARNQVYHQVRQLSSELRQALNKGYAWPCFSEGGTMLSPYSRAGARLASQRICVTTDRPLDSLLPASPPGSLYIITRPGEPGVRLRGTVLSRNVDATPIWLENFRGDPVEVRVLSPHIPISLHLAPQPNTTLE